MKETYSSLHRSSLTQACSQRRLAHSTRDKHSYLTFKAPNANAVRCHAIRTAPHAALQFLRVYQEASTPAIALFSLHRCYNRTCDPSFSTHTKDCSLVEYIFQTRFNIFYFYLSS